MEIKRVNIAVVVAVFNGALTIRKCLDSIFGQLRLPDQVIVIDDGSEDDTLNIVRNEYPHALLIVNDRNEGVSAARNRGIRAVSADWIATVDSDAYLDKDFILCFERHLTEAKEHSLKNGGDKTGIVVPKIFFPGGRRVYSIGHRLTYLRRFYEAREGANVFGACSAAAFYNRRMLEELREGADYFDSRFFIMAEDVDIAWRARKKGWRVALDPACVAFHPGNFSGDSVGKKTFYSIRNRFIMIMKNESMIYVVLFFIPLALYEFARFARLLAQGKGAIYLSAVRSALMAGKKIRTGL